jgi:hypothetical protein
MEGLDRCDTPAFLVSHVNVKTFTMDNGQPDRSIVLVKSCGCVSNLSIPLQDKPPRTGEPWHCSLHDQEERWK